MRVLVKVTIKSILGLLHLVLLLPFNVSSQEFPLSDNNFSNPQFVSRFLGSYGVNSNLNPELLQSDIRLLKYIEPLVQENTSEAIDYLLPKMDEDSTAAINFTLAQLYFQNGEPDKSIPYYERAIQLFPDFMRAHRGLGIAYIQNEDLEENEKCELGMPFLLKAMELGQPGGLVHGFMGYCHLVTGNYSSAVTTFKMARAFQPNNIDWKIGEAKALLASGDYLYASLLLDELIRQFPQNIDLLLLQANSYAALNQPQEAIVNYRYIGYLNQSKESDLVQLGDLYLIENIPVRATESYISALKIHDSVNIERFIEPYYLLLENGNLEEASTLLNEVKLTFGTEIEAYESVVLLADAELNFQREDLAIALGQLREILSDDPLNGRALFLLGRVYNELGDFERAELYYDRAARDDGFAYNAIVNHARMAANNQKFQKALELLLEANEIEPSLSLQKNIDILKRAAVNRRTN